MQAQRIVPEAIQQRTEFEERHEKLQLMLDGFYQQHYLSQFQKFAVTKFVRDTMAGKDTEKARRARDWLLLKLNKKRYTDCHEGQRGCPDIVPGLRAMPWWPATEFPWFKAFQQNMSAIQAEVLALRREKGFQPYRGPSWITGIPAKDGVGKESVDTGQWNVYYLFLHDMKFEENCAKLPVTVNLIEKHIPRHYCHAFVSAVVPGTHIMKHYGPTNKKLRFHLPLMGVAGSRLRVWDQTNEQEQGKCYVFDDSFEHEAWHEGPDTRVILIVDFWHPDLAVEEIKFMDLLHKSKMKAERKLSALDPTGDNFFSIIDQAKTLLTNNDWWTLNEALLKT